MIGRVRTLYSFFFSLFSWKTDVTEDDNCNYVFEKFKILIIKFLHLFFKNAQPVYNHLEN